jgi:hypothetical protein
LFALVVILQDLVTGPNFLVSTPLGYERACFYLKRFDRVGALQV